MKATLRRLITRLLKRSSGFTLIEMLIALGIMTAAVSMVGSTVFQVLGIQRYWRDDVVAVRQLRHAGSVFAGDAFNTESIDLVDGAAPVSSVTLEWTDSSGILHTARYSLANGRLVRNIDGDSVTVARDVVDVAFSLSGQTVTFYLEIQAGAGETRSKTLDTYLRFLEL